MYLSESHEVVKSKKSLWSCMYMADLEKMGPVVENLIPFMGPMCLQTSWLKIQDIWMTMHDKTLTEK